MRTKNYLEDFIEDIPMEFKMTYKEANEKVMGLSYMDTINRVAKYSDMWLSIADKDTKYNDLQKQKDLSAFW